MVLTRTARRRPDNYWQLILSRGKYSAYNDVRWDLLVGRAERAIRRLGGFAGRPRERVLGLVLCSSRTSSCSCSRTRRPTTGAGQGKKMLSDPEHTKHTLDARTPDGSPQHDSDEHIHAILEHPAHSVSARQVTFLMLFLESRP